jgi:ADP-ribose pyrophosphatase YjhB (NUDIX family)
MPKPVTPFVGCDVFVTDTEHRVLLIRRADNGLWALPGGAQDLHESAQQGAVRECKEETGYDVRVTHLLGVFSSTCYEYVHYPWKENQFTHLLFRAELIGGEPATSPESTEVKWFSMDSLPPLSDGHEPRISFGFNWLKNPHLPPYFE